ncbi:MAG TPA: VCBS repeat-containing protein [Candidatus Solibacter sp.]|nr:VCBS repeat-containing protein [Candidatus Solibacter sp.]
MQSPLSRTSLLLGMLMVFRVLGVAQVTFGAPAFYPVGGAPVAVATDDFNNDGNLDLAVVNSDANTVSILLGNGDGTFQAAVKYTVGLNPVAITIVDINLDKKLDLAVAYEGDITAQQTGGISLLLGNGDGTFSPLPDLASTDYPTGIVAGPFHGKPDLAIVTFDGGVNVFLGNGDGTFEAAVAYEVTGASRSIAAGDFDGDGKEDLLVTTDNSMDSLELYRGNASVLIGKGDGTFITPPLDTSLGGPGGPVVAGDFNGDGHLDLAALVLPLDANLLAQVQVFLGHGDGTFGAGAVVVKGLSVVHPWGGKIIVSDINNDGAPDLFVDGLWVFLGQGDGTFQLAFTNAAGAEGSAIGDFNGDGLPDLAETSASSIAVLLNTTTDFALSASTLTPTTLSAGQSSTAKLTLNAANGFTGTISLTCTVQPQPQSAPSCSISPNSANPGTPVTLTVTTTGTTMALAAPSASRSGLIYALGFPVIGFVLVGIAAGSLRSRSKNARSFVCGSLLVTGMFLQAACGGGSADPPQHQSLSTPPGQYTVTLIANSGSLHHLKTLTLTVQ